MQQKIYRIGILCWLTLTAGIAVAQKAENSKATAPAKLEVVMDGSKAVNKEWSIVYDSLDLINAHIQIENDKMYIISDTLPKQVTKATLDFKKDSALFHRKDSMYKRSISSFKRNDSLFRKSQVEFKAAQKAKQVSDAAFRKKQIEYRQAQKLNRSSDSTFKRSQLDFSTSSQLFKQNHKLDSLRKLDWKKDSLRIKRDLKILKSNLKQLKTDSARLQNSLRRKMIVTKEFSCNDNAQLVIDKIGRKLTIRTATGNSIKIETVLVYDSTVAPKNVNWEQQFNIAVSGDRNKLIITKANAEAPSQKTTSPTGASYKSPVTIYVPASVKINIEHRYNDLVIMDNFASVDLDLFNAPLIINEVQQAVIKSRYGSVKAININNADLDLLNCNFILATAEKIKVTSKYSSVVIKKAGNVDMKSFSDQYVIAKAGNISGSKSFGQFTITLLENAISLNGSSADLKIDAIDVSAKTIKVENKYADIKLPVQKLSNYSLQVDGDYSKIVTPFESIRTGAKDSLKTVNPRFTKTVGQTGKDFTEFIVKCNSCSVDFL